MNDDREQIWKDFREAANMAPAELEKWLETEDSKRVGQKSESGGESVGHKSGRRVIAIKRKRKADLTDADHAHMKKVVGYVARHREQRPKQDVKESDWRYSLMNWGHDPLK
jgi:hypothetical protein